MSAARRRDEPYRKRPRSSESRGETPGEEKVSAVPSELTRRPSESRSVSRFPCNLIPKGLPMKIWVALCHVSPDNISVAVPVRGAGCVRQAGRNRSAPHVAVPVRGVGCVLDPLEARRIERGCRPREGCRLCPQSWWDGARDAWLLPSP